MRKFTFLMALVLMVSTLNAQELRSRKAINPTGTTEKSVLTRPDKSTLNNSVNLQKAISVQPFALATKQSTAPVRATRAATIFSENFDGALTGWTSTTSATPNWQQGNPLSNPFTAIDASNVNSITHGYSDPLTLDNIIYATVDLTGYTSGLTLNFWAGYSGPWMTGGIETSPSFPGADVKAVVSTNGGTTWTPLWAYTDSHNGTENWAWEEYAVSLDAYAGQTILVGFQYIGKGGDLAAIDNVFVLEGCANFFTTAATTTAVGNTLTTTWAISNAPDSYIVEVNGEAVTTPPAATATSYTFTAPNDGPYVVKVIAVYSGCPNATSTATVIVGIPCQWTIDNMTDGYGDGWEGLVAVFQNGVNTAVLYLEDGFGPETQTFDVYSGPIEMWWIDGYFSSGYDYNEENFTIYDNNGSEIFSTNGLSITINTNPPVFYTGIVNCGPPATADAAITAITAPVSGMNLTATETVTATIKNNGSDPITSMQLELKVDGTVVATETFTGNIAANATANHTFTATANLSAAGDHTIIVTAILAGDANTANDSFTKIVNNTICDAVTALPLVQNFDDDSYLCWEMISNNAPNGPGGPGASAYSFPMGVYNDEGLGIFVFCSYNLAADYSQYLISPMLPATNGNLTVGFDYIMVDGWGGETFKVGYSTTTNSISDFTWGPEQTATNEYFDGEAFHNYQDILPEGTKYFAIWYTSEYAYQLGVTNIVIDGEVAAVPVEVVSTSPADNAVDVAIDAEVSVTFNQDITENDLTGILINGSAATASVSGSKLIISHSDFDNDTEYTVVVPANAITDYAAAITWSFTTKIASSIPVVNGNEINIFQNNGEINVVVSEKSDIRILDMLGRVLGNYNVNSTLKVSQPAGMYLIEVRSGGAVSTHKVVVK